MYICHATSHPRSAHPFSLSDAMGACPLRTCENCRHRRRSASATAGEPQNHRILEILKIISAKKFRRLHPAPPAPMIWDCSQPDTCNERGHGTSCFSSSKFEKLFTLLFSTTTVCLLFSIISVSANDHYPSVSHRSHGHESLRPNDNTKS